jgi:hypothetical protein
MIDRTPKIIQYEEIQNDEEKMATVKGIKRNNNSSLNRSLTKSETSFCSIKSVPQGN